MNAQTADFTADGAPEGQALAVMANIEDLTAGRDRAIALWLESYDTLHANMDAAAAASIGGRIGLQTPDDRYSDSRVTRAFLVSGETRRYDRELRRDVIGNARDDFSSIVTKEVDRRCWSHLMTQLGFDQLLDRQGREEFQQSLRDTPPEFTPENCRATFSNVWGNRREMYLRGIANVFMKMDRRFRSHDAFAIGNRLIIERAFSDSGRFASWNSYDRRDTLHDVERIFRELDGLGTISPDNPAGIVSQITSAKRTETLPYVVHGDYFRVRVFGNGNLHLWFERKDLLKQVNALLLEYYKPVEGDVGEGPSYEAGPAYHATPAKHFGAYNSSAEVAKEVMRRAEIGQGCRVLEPSAGTGVLAKAARDRGAEVTCVELQPGLAHELTVLHGFDDVTQGDFLEQTAERLGLFDVIVMNPPFDRGRDCDHVRHAYKFLKPGGRIVSVMSARAEFANDARHKALHDLIAQCDSRWERTWHDLPERSFAHAGTNVNTVTLLLKKPR